MTFRRIVSPPRKYETFPDQTSAESSRRKCRFEKSRSSSDKGQSAAQQAQLLGSQTIWIDNHVYGHSNSSNMGREILTSDEEEGRYPPYTDNVDSSDPPPIYTPSDTTATPTTTTSGPMSDRGADPAQHNVGSSNPRTSNRYDPPSSSQLPEVVVVVEEPDQEQRNNMPGSFPPSLASNGAVEKRRCNIRGPKWRKKSKKFKRVCWFMTALAICLWLLIPGLMGCCSKQSFNFTRPHAGHGGSSNDNPQTPLPRREYRQHETSNSIRGTFSLYDLVELSTTSGSISVTINPETGHKPARLYLKTTSGSINVHMASQFISSQSDNNRTLETSITTTSGTVTGSLIHGNGGNTDIKTTSGSIMIDVEPLGVGPRDSLSRLSTTTHSGSQNINVRSPRGGKVSNLRGSHTSIGSGSLTINYPSGWEGQVHAQSFGSGSIDVSGSDLKFWQKGNKDVIAQRGNTEVEVGITAMGSGSVRFSC